MTNRKRKRQPYPFQHTAGIADVAGVVVGALGAGPLGAVVRPSRSGQTLRLAVSGKDFRRPSPIPKRQRRRSVGPGNALTGSQAVASRWQRSIPEGESDCALDVIGDIDPTCRSAGSMLARWWGYAVLARSFRGP